MDFPLFLCGEDEWCYLQVSDMCDLVTLVMCVSLALVASSALPALVPADGSALRAGDDCQHEVGI